MSTLTSTFRISNVVGKRLKYRACIASLNPNCYFSNHSTQLQQYYDTLEIPTDADKKTIKSQFYKLSKKFHPDVNLNSEEAHASFLRINEAYSVLGNENSRKDYDRSIRSSTAGGVRFRSRRPSVQVNTMKRTQPKTGKTRYNLREHYARHYSADERERSRQREKAREEKKLNENFKEGFYHRLVYISSLIAVMGMYTLVH
ncbi:hypothetical protein K7432_014286 [Basidiobolus ranarum]|uniref:J domain-containing protein n=1 Tax=Basidiobolus ranarum TaxID=34480 RepID=A0ABR2WHS7_9FUNG